MYGAHTPSHRRGFTHQMIDWSLSTILARLNVERNEGHSRPDRRRRDNSVTCSRRMVLPNNLLFANLAALNALASAATRSRVQRMWKVSPTRSSFVFSGWGLAVGSTNRRILQRESAKRSTDLPIGRTVPMP